MFPEMDLRQVLVPSRLSSLSVSSLVPLNVSHTALRGQERQGLTWYSVQLSETIPHKSQTHYPISHIYQKPIISTFPYLFLLLFSGRRQNLHPLHQSDPVTTVPYPVTSVSLKLVISLLMNRLSLASCQLNYNRIRMRGSTHTSPRRRGRDSPRIRKFLWPRRDGGRGRWARHYGQI